MTHKDLIAILPNRQCKVVDGVLIITGSGHVYLYNLTALPDNVTFKNGGNVYLSNLIALPDNVTFKNGGEVYLSSIAAIPDNVTFKNGGNVYLSNLTTDPQMYQDKPRRFRTIDYWTMLIERSRKVGEYTIHSARYFGGGEISELEPCKIAEKDGYFAHGDTVESAVRDVRFKIAQVNYDASELIERVKREGVIGSDDFRLLTGACPHGLQHGLESLGLAPDTESLPLDKAMQLVRGQFGEHRMIEAFGKV